MSDAIQHLDLDSDEYYDAPKALRQYAEKLKKALDSTTKELTTVRGQVAAQAIGEVLSGQGFKNPKRVEKDLLADGVDPLDKSAVEGWLAEFGDDYAKGAAAPASETPSVPDDEVAAHRSLNLDGEFRQPADMSKVDAAITELPTDATPEQVLAHFKAKGL